MGYYPQRDMTTAIQGPDSSRHCMVLGVVPEPRHMDELDPFYRQHRLLGCGIVIGGLLGLGLYVGALFALDVNLRVAAMLSAAWLGPIVFGALWYTWGADMMQRHSADQMNE